MGVAALDVFDDLEAVSELLFVRRALPLRVPERVTLKFSVKVSGLSV